MDRDARPDLLGEIRFKVPLPIVIPLGALVVIAIVAIGFARVLLAVEKEVAVALALVAALNVLGAATVLALRPRLRGAALVELAVVVLYPVLIGIVIANIGIGGEAGEGVAAGEDGPPPPAGDAVVTAEGVAFDTDTIELPADQPVVIVFRNQDTVPHNIAIYESEEATRGLFVGEIFTGPATRDYEFQSPPRGEFYFQCDVHPSMNGTVVVTGGGEEAEEIRGGEEGGEEGGG